MLRCRRPSRSRSGPKCRGISPFRSGSQLEPPLPSTRHTQTVGAREVRLTAPAVRLTIDRSRASDSVGSFAAHCAWSSPGCNLVACLLRAGSSAWGRSLDRRHLLLDRPASDCVRLQPSLGVAPLRKCRRCRGWRSYFCAMSSIRAPSSAWRRLPSNAARSHPLFTVSSGKAPAQALQAGRPIRTHSHSQCRGLRHLVSKRGSSLGDDHQFPVSNSRWRSSRSI